MKIAIIAIITAIVTTTTTKSQERDSMAASDLFLFLRSNSNFNLVMNVFFEGNNVCFYVMCYYLRVLKWCDCKECDVLGNDLFCSYLLESGDQCLWKEFKMKYEIKNGNKNIQNLKINKNLCGLCIM